MSNSTDKTGCISHRANSRFFIMFEDYLEVAAKVSSKEHRHKLAAFWRVLETKTNDRITYNEERIEHAKKHNLPIPETSLWVEIPYSEFVNRSLEVYKSSSFQIAAAESERLGFCESKNLKRRVNPLDPQSPLEDYKEYLFFSDVMQAALTEGKYPTPIENNSPLLKSLAKRKEERAVKNNTPPIENNSRGIENNTPPLLNSTPPPIENNRNKYSKGYSKYKKDTEEDSFASRYRDDAEASEEIPAISNKQTPSASPAAAPDLPLASPSKPEPAASGNENDTQSQLFTSYPPEPKATTKWGTRKCLAWFDYWRGGILIGKYKNGQASNCAKGLAEQFDEATVIQIRDRMAAQQYWIDRGGPDVCDVANNIHKELKKVRTKGQPPTSKTDVELVEYEGERMTRDEAMARGYSDFDRYIGNGKAEREALVADAMKDPLFWEIMNDGKEPVQV